MQWCVSTQRTGKFPNLATILNKRDVHITFMEFWTLLWFSFFFVWLGMLEGISLSPKSYRIKINYSSRIKLIDKKTRHLPLFHLQKWSQIDDIIHPALLLRNIVLYYAAFKESGFSRHDILNFSLLMTHGNYPSHVHKQSTGKNREPTRFLSYHLGIYQPH